MGLMDRLFSYAQDVIKLAGEVEDLSEDLARIDAQQRSHAERLVRLETIIELAGGGRGGRLPPG